MWRFLVALQLLPALESGEETLVGGQAVLEGVMMRSPHACAIKLMPSVVPRVKIISSALRALIKLAARARAASKAAVARLLNS